MEIHLLEYYRMFRKRLWLIAGLVVLFTVPTALLTGNSYQPLYQAATKMIVNSASDQPQFGQQLNFGGMNLDFQSIDNYKEIIKTPVILDKVVQMYPDLHLSSEQLGSRISVSYLNGSQVMTITAQDYSYERAVKVANDVSQVFQQEIPKIMKVQSVTILTMAKMESNPRPVNKKSHQYVLLSLIGSLVIGVGLVLFLDSIDDTLKSEEDVRILFEAPTLAVVPVLKQNDFRPRKNRIKNEAKGRVTHATRGHE